MKSLLLLFGFLSLWVGPSMGQKADSTTAKPKTLATAKRASQERKKFLVLGANAVAYKGSLSETYKSWTPAVQFGLRFQKKKSFNGLVSITVGKVIGEDPNYVKPASASADVNPVTRFQTRFISVSYQVQIRLFETHGLRIYASPGVGIFNFTPKDLDGNNLNTKDRTRSKGESYGSTSLNFPLQFGLQYWFPNKMAFGFEAGYLFPQTAFLDNMKALSQNTRRDNISCFRFQWFLPFD